MARAAKTTAKKSKAAQPETTKPVDEPVKQRRIRYDGPKSFSLQSKRITVPQAGTIAPGRRIFSEACRLIWRSRKSVGVILIIFGAINLLLISGLSGSAQLQGLRDGFNEALQGGWGKLSSGVALYTFLISSFGSNSVSATTSAYQAVLVLITSLALIWAYRHIYAGHAVRVRDAYYRSCAPLVPVLLVLAVVALQLLPAAGGVLLYILLVNGGIVSGLVEGGLTVLLCFLLVTVSLYMLCASLPALYIATLSDMTPLKALRSSRELVRFRRWVVLRKLLFLPVALLLIGAVIMIPFILTIPVAAIAIFYVYSILAIAVAHAYMYGLYRQLITR